VNDFKLALTKLVVLLKVRKDVKLTTLGGRLFQATATRSLKSFTHDELALIYDNFTWITIRGFSKLSSENKHLDRYQSNRRWSYTLILYQPQVSDIPGSVSLICPFWRTIASYNKQLCCPKEAARCFVSLSS